MKYVVKTLVGGLVFPEGPRWRAGRLWFSDMEDNCVKSVSPDGELREELRIDDYTSGLGWLPDGRMLVVSVKQQKLLAVKAGTAEVHADLSNLARSYINDMVVDRHGRAYVGSMGYDIWADPEPKPGNLILVRPDGEKIVAAERMMFPNGAVITPDGRQLIVAESLSKCLTAFHIDADGSLSGRRLWAETAGVMPDGICLDSRGGIWIAAIETGAVLRIEEGGDVTDVIDAPDGRQAWAVALGGEDGRTLFMLTSSPLGDTREARLESRPGRIEVTRVEHPATDIG